MLFREAVEQIQLGQAQSCLLSTSVISGSRLLCTALLPYNNCLFPTHMALEDQQHKHNQIEVPHERQCAVSTCLN
jgi:hypothetical protein